MKAANICGKRIRLARTDKEWDQVELAAALSVDHGLDLTQSTVSAIERGSRGVSDIELVALADVLEVSATWLLYGNKFKRSARG